MRFCGSLSSWAGALTVSMILAGAAHAATILNEDWTTGYTKDTAQAPRSPWQVSDATAPDETITVLNGKLYYHDSDNRSQDGLGNSIWNPSLYYTFSQSTTQNLNISFSYRLSSETNSQMQFALRDSTGKAAVVIGLGKSFWPANGLYYVDTSGNKVQFPGHTYSATETVTISLTNINLTTGTYDIAWSTDNTNATTKSGTITGAVFNGTVTNFNSIRLFDNTGGNALAEFQLGAIIIETVPEPTSLSLAVLAGGALLTTRRMQHE